MTVPGPADHGYLILDQRDLGEACRAPVEAAVAELVRKGWRASHAVEDLQVLVGPRARLRVRQVGRRHVLIGDWRGPRPLSTLVAVNSRPADLARAVVGAGWGRYILAWRDDDGRLALLRDPTGAVDCVWWRHGGAVLAVAEPPRELDPLLPADLTIDWTVLREIAEAPELLGDRLALTGLTAVNPGTLALIAGDQASVPVWRPSTFCRSGAGWDESLGGLSGVVDETVADLVDPHRRVVAELSGGLDSAIVAGSLAATGRAGRARFLNFHGDWREGDERPWAEAVAHRLKLDLATIRKPVKAITLRQLRPLGESVRPALQGVDVTYDGEVAARMRRGRATALLTGQGGDAVFFQAPDPAVAADRFRREGPPGLSPAFLAAVGRWTRHSAWTVLGCALGLRATGPRPASGRRHPWLEDIEDLPPAKTGQLRQFVNAQLFWGDCLRARAGDLLHPLLSQPVVEHCLAIPADRLIAGVRDRGLARRAFADRLPPMLIERRNKGDLSCFYGHVTRASLATLKPLLLNGLQVDQGLLDGKTLERDLAADRLIVGPGYNRLLVGAVLEVWAQHWEGRIAEVRRARVAAAVIARSAPRVSNWRYEEGSRMSRGSDQGPHCGAR